MSIKSRSIYKHTKLKKLPLVVINKYIDYLTYKDIFKAKDNPRAVNTKKGRLRVGASIVESAERFTTLSTVHADVYVVVKGYRKQWHSRGVIETLRKVNN
jgi:IMP dehydrogenase